MGGGAKIYNCSDKVTAGVIHHRLWSTAGVQNFKQDCFFAFSHLIFITDIGPSRGQYMTTNNKKLMNHEEMYPGGKKFS